MTVMGALPTLPIYPPHLPITFTQHKRVQKPHTKTTHLHPLLDSPLHSCRPIVNWHKILLRFM